MELERKENAFKCELCEDTNLVHVTVGWKDYSFFCPKCKPSDFKKGTKNVGLSEELAITMIISMGKPGE